MQYVAHLYVRNEARPTLAKADQHLALARNILDSEPRLAPIAPGRIIHDRRKQGIRCDTPDLAKIVDQYRLLGLYLRRRVEVLQAAATTHAVLCAAWFHADL